MSEWGIHGARGAFQGVVEALMRTLLEDHPTLLRKRDVANLMDAEYCKGALGLAIANFALLRPREAGHMVQGHARYWKHVYADRFYVCSQWWKDHHPTNAAALSAFAAGIAARSAAHPGTAALRRHIEDLDRYAAAAGPAQSPARHDTHPPSRSAHHD